MLIIFHIIVTHSSHELRVTADDLNLLPEVCDYITPGIKHYPRLIACLMESFPIALLTRRPNLSPGIMFNAVTNGNPLISFLHPHHCWFQCRPSPTLHPTRPLKRTQKTTASFPCQHSSAFIELHPDLS